MSLLKNKYFNFFVFFFFTLLVFIVFRDLFNSYFEADEWFHFTIYLPLIREPYGFLLTLIKTVTDTLPLSRGQHVVPIGEELFFLNTLFFDTNYTPYIFLSLLLHSINSFLVFLFIKELLNSKKLEPKKTVIALLGGIFFALSQIHFHAFAWAAFYGQNNLSVTFFLLCLLFFKKALNTNKKIFIFVSLFFLFLDLFTKETTTALFFILPVMALIERNVFSLKYLAKLYVIALILFITFRFIIPNVYLGLGQLADRWVDSYISSARTSVGSEDSGTIVSTDLSIHENIYRELAFRAITFPVKMTSEFFFPRETIHFLVSLITPVIYPQPGGGDEAVRVQYRQFFLNGPGNDFLVYILSVSIIIFLAFQARNFLKNKKIIEFQTIITGLAIIFFACLPLVLIVLSFPRWGYDTYFDSRHYYMPSVGAAIIFPFLVFGIGDFFLKIIPRFLHFKKLPSILAFLIFAIWFTNNLYVLNRNFDVVVDIVGAPRRKIISQLKTHVPVLPQKAIFYIQTDGLGAYGSLMPFQTPFPQILTVVYYDKNPLPDSFFKTFIFDAEPEGYLFSENRGFGFYNSKKTLSKVLVEGLFSTRDLYSFYYDSQKGELTNITKSVRDEMNKYLKDYKKNEDWKPFNDPVTKLTFKYPLDTTVSEGVVDIVQNPKVLKLINLSSPRFFAQIKVFAISPTLDTSEIGLLINSGAGRSSPKKVFFDNLNLNDAVFTEGKVENQYLIKLGDKLVYLTTQNQSEEPFAVIEKILGSIRIEM